MEQWIVVWNSRDGHAVRVDLSQPLAPFGPDGPVCYPATVTSPAGERHLLVREEEVAARRRDVRAPGTH